MSVKTGFVCTVLILLTVLGSPTAALAAHEDDQQNNHAAAFLRAGVDARYLGMGGAGSAVADDVGAAYWNPAGLAMVRGLSVTGMFTDGLNFDRRHNFVAGAYGTGALAVAVSWINAGTDDLKVTDDIGVLTGDSFDYGENAIFLSAAARAGAVNLGISGKFITQDLGTETGAAGDDLAVGYGVDVGAQFFFTPYARLGFMIQDIFAQVGGEENERVNDVPANLRLGLALEPVDGFIMAADFEKTRDDDDLRFHGGGEFQVPLGNQTASAVRLGVEEGELTGGFGVELGFLHLDYAYVIEPEAFLDENHRFSVTLDFGSRRDLVRAGGFDDRDHDGIPDGEDACPDQSEDFDGYRDFDGCPDVDNDEDGIPDLQDLCPDEPETLNGVDDEDGCPDDEAEVGDRDGDGIADHLDRCPDEPETVNAFEDEDGCPDEITLEFPSVYIHFLSGSTEIPDAGGNAELMEAIRILKEYPGIQVEIQGHTDSVGDPAFNQKLSERRAEAVRQFVVSQGIDPLRVFQRGYGETRPVDSNDTDEGRARNRRIEFVVITPK